MRSGDEIATAKIHNVNQFCDCGTRAKMETEAEKRKFYYVLVWLDPVGCVGVSV